MSMRARHISPSVFDETLTCLVSRFSYRKLDQCLLFLLKMQKTGGMHAVSFNLVV